MHLLALLLFVSAVAAKDECAPVTWANGGVKRAEPRDGALPRAASPKSILSSRDVQDLQAGQINCRYSSTSASSVNYYTCTEMATRYGISVELFFQFNPTLTLDCGNIQPKTKYCVAGFVEPVRAVNGLCGPKNDNATCLGTTCQCCNAKTWTCGSTDADCADGTCYEGACAGDEIYSTDGTCGSGHGNRLCAGVWGDCCSRDGKCGSGGGFCGVDACQSGNCTRPVVVPSNPPWMSGNTTDGTCGEENKYSCSVVYGNCCNKDNVCGSLASDCGAGCQPQWGSCSSVGTDPTSSKTSTKTSSSATSAKSSTKTSSSDTTAKTSTKTSSSATSIKTTSRGTTAKTSTKTSSSATSIKTTSTDTTSTCETSTTTSKPPTTTTASTESSTISKTTTALSSLPSCGQTCFNNMLAQYSALGCATQDPACLCCKPDFSNGIRDCSNEACGTAVASAVIAYGSAFCSSATAAPTKTATSTSTAPSSLPSCGQTCFNNMLAQYSALGCATQDPACLCCKPDFSNGIRDCSNEACGTAVASAVIAYGSAYCAKATGT